MTPEQVKEIRWLHLLWLHDESAGKRADLYGAELSGADLRSADLRRANLRGAKLSGADMRWATGNDREIKNAEPDRWRIVYTAEVMAIGCEQHAIAEWFDFDDDMIDAMDKHALEWWREWKPKLQQIIADDPAVKTGWEERNA